MRIIKAPGYFNVSERPKVFLAGSIEMGKAENWQEKCERLLVDRSGTILNPRRDDWDSTWVSSIYNPQFREQVEWELDAMYDADVILMYFDKDTKSPISLFELGLNSKNSHGRSKKLVVRCPEDFWKKGNVDVVCNYYAISQVDTIEDLVASV